MPGIVPRDYLADCRMKRINFISLVVGVAALCMITDPVFVLGLVLILIGLK